jgi:DNA invertase Pin-like site-specific DNA recombinase
LLACFPSCTPFGLTYFCTLQGFDTTTSSGKAMFQMLGVLAEFERSIIQEGVRAGLRRAKDEGKQLGCPRGASDLEKRILDALNVRKAAGDSVRKFVDRFGVAASTVQAISRPFDGSKLAA